MANEFSIPNNVVTSSDSRTTVPAIGSLLVVDDEKTLLASVKRIFQRAGWRVITKDDPIQALPILKDERIDVVLTDVRMPRMNGVEFCRVVKERRPDVEVVVMTAIGSIEIAVEAMKAGACDFLTKPFDHPEMVAVTLSKALERRKLTHRNRYLEKEVELKNRFENIIGTTSKMKNVFRLIESVASADATVLILGESGTGKELVARAIHERSPRRARPFLAINCSAFTESLLASELFGHVKGAFTGAANYRKGLFEEGDNGTVFLDEIGDTTPAMQAKLLRVLQEGEFTPVGSNQVKKTNLRVIAATNVDLPAAIKSGRFREDLYYRINVIPIALPPLRERSEDIPLLAHHFVAKYAKKTAKGVGGIDREAMAVFLAHRWPGNVRELENMVERAVVLCQGGNVTVNDLPEGMVSLNDPNETVEAIFEAPFSQAKSHTVASFERRYLDDVLTRAGGVISEAARLAGKDRSNFRRLMSRYRLDSADYRHD